MAKQGVVMKKVERFGLLEVKASGLPINRC